MAYSSIAHHCSPALLELGAGGGFKMTSFPPIEYPYSYETMTVLELVYILWIYGVGLIVLTLLAWVIVEFGRIAWGSIGEKEGQ